MPGDSATQQAIEAMQDYGIDLTEHRSRPLNPEIIQNADVILAMTKNHRRQILARFPEAEAKTYVLKELAYANRNNDKLGQEKGEVEKNPSIDVDVNDPFGQSVEVYRKTAKEIEDALVALLDNVLEVEQ